MSAAYSCWISADGQGGTIGEPALIFPYWSFSKTAIAICALKLHERGEVDLDRPLDGKKFTLRQLLQHTAGLPDYGGLQSYHDAVLADEEPWPVDRLMSAARADTLLFEPGQGWAYSNIGYMLARRHIEERSGKDFGSLFAELVAEPLRLTSIELATTREQFSHVHWSTAQHYHPGWVYHGCLMGTPRDAALLLHALLSGELLQDETLHQMLDAHPLGGRIEGRPWTDCGYGLGLMMGRMEDVGRVIGHSGGGPFSVNAVYHFPDLDQPVTVATFAEGSNEGVAEYEAVRLAGAPMR